LYWVSEGTVQIYLMIAEIPMDISTMEAIEPKAWRMPVFLFALVTLVAILLFTRVARHHRFWVFCMVFNIYIGLFMLTLYIKCLYTIRKMPNMDVNWGFPQRKTWTHNFSYVLFLLLPFRLVSIDAPAQ
jgi:hypothetical protein